MRYSYRLLLLFALSLTPIFVSFAVDITVNEKQALFWGRILVSIPVALLFGGITALVLQTKRSIWWAMIFVFIWNYFGSGLIFGEFATAGYFDTSILNVAAVLAVVAFCGALFTWALFTVFKKQLLIMKQAQAQAKKQKP